jgi:hypothetical protein
MNKLSSLPSLQHCKEAFNSCLNASDKSNKGPPRFQKRNNSAMQYIQKSKYLAEEPACPRTPRRIRNLPSFSSIYVSGCCLTFKTRSAVSFSSNMSQKSQIISKMGDSATQPAHVGVSAKVIKKEKMSKTRKKQIIARLASDWETMINFEPVRSSALYPPYV